MFVRGWLLFAVVALSASGCTRTEPNSLYQPMDENFADPVPLDPVRQQVEEDPLLDNRERVATEQRTAPEELRRSEDEDDDVDPD